MLIIGANEIKNNVLETIGNTPLVKLSNISKGVKPKIYAKLEYMNPGGSIKDRMALYMIEDAEKNGLLKPGGIIVENTSGNTGVGLAIVAAVKGYKAIFTIPDKMSQEKINLLKAFGAEVIHKKLVKPHVYKVEGIGEDYLVKAMDFSVVDDMIQVNDKNSFLTARRLAREEGIFAGGSSGAAVWAALELAKTIDDDKVIVTILPDSGSRYLSKFYNDEWMNQNGFL